MLNVGQFKLVWFEIEPYLYKAVPFTFYNLYLSNLILNNKIHNLTSAIKEFEGKIQALFF